MGSIILDATEFVGKKQRLLNTINNAVKAYGIMHTLPDMILITEKQLEYIWTSGQLLKYPKENDEYDAFLRTPYNAMEVRIKKQLQQS